LNTNNQPVGDAVPPVRDGAPPVTIWLLEPRDLTRWVPFSPTRAVGELLFGTVSLRERIEAALGQPVQTGGATPAEGAPASDPGRTRVFLRANVIPDGSGVELWRALARPRLGADPVLELRVEGEGVGMVFPPGAPLDAEPQGTVALPGRMLGSPWDLMHGNAAQITEDLTAPEAHALGHRPSGDEVHLSSNSTVHVLGAYPVTMAPGGQIDPFVVLDAREGPIHLGPGVQVDAFSRVVGPAWIGAESRILGGVVAHVTLGPVCRVRGEVEATIFHGWSNKAHDGYLGHAVVGSWVNLGAFTTNSDLKNTYGPVRAPLGPETTLDTGLIKAGVLLGDHVKTGIGTLLGTGTVVGAGTNLFGGVLPPVWVPPFSWGTGERLGVYRLDRFLEVAARAMARRKVALTDADRDTLAAAWEASHGAP